MGFTVERTNAFKKDLKRYKRRPCDFGLLKNVNFEIQSSFKFLKN
jgi:hypothetical protein